MAKPPQAQAIPYKVGPWIDERDRTLYFFFLLPLPFPSSKVVSRSSNGVGSGICSTLARSS